MTREDELEATREHLADAIKAVNKAMKAAVLSRKRREKAEDVLDAMYDIFCDVDHEVEIRKGHVVGRD